MGDEKDSPAERYAPYRCACDPCLIGYTRTSLREPYAPYRCACDPCLIEKRSLAERAVRALLRCVRSVFDPIQSASPTATTTAGLLDTQRLIDKPCVLYYCAYDPIWTGYNANTSCHDGELQWQHLQRHEGPHEVQRYGSLAVRRLVRENLHGNQSNSPSNIYIDGRAHPADHVINR